MGLEQQIVGRPFVSVGRAVLAYLFATAMGAVSFVPFLLIERTLKHGLDIDPAPVLSLGGRLQKAILVEIGSVLGGWIFLAPVMIPIYVCAMALAIRFSIERLRYYLGLGVIMSCLAWSWPSILSGNRLASNLSDALVFAIVVTLPIGLLGGSACWVFLKLTR